MINSVFTRRCANLSGERVGCLKAGASKISIHKKSGSHRLLIDGCDIANSEEIDPLIKLVISAVKSIADKNKPTKVTIRIRDWPESGKEQIDELVSGVKSREDIPLILDNKSISPPKFEGTPENSEYQIRENFDKLSMSLSEFSRQASNVSSIIQSALDTALCLTRKLPDKTIWGSKKIGSILTGIRSGIQNCGGLKDDIDFYGEMLDKDCGKSVRCLEMQTPESIDVLRRIIAPDISRNYHGLKDCIGKCVIAIIPLVNIDGDFQSTVQTPSDWFISADSMDGLKEDYGHVVDFMVDEPKMENKVVAPLEAMTFQK